MTAPTDHELRRLFERSPVAMYRSTSDGRFLAVNAAMVAMLEYRDADQMLALNLDRDIYIDSQERLRLMARYRKEGGFHDAEVRWRTRTGKELLVRIYPRLIAEQVGETFDVTAVDITALAATARELREGQAQLARTTTTLDLVLRQMSGMYWVVDRDLRITSTGGAVEAVLGYPLEQNLGKTLYETHVEDPGDPDPITVHLRALRGEIVSYISTYRGKHLANTVSPSRDGDSTIVGVIGTAIDVTASHVLERRMVDAQRAESLGVLAGGLAHDFNNLLVAILGNADLALNEIAVGSPGRAALDNIRGAGLRAAELTHQLLAYAGRGGVATTEVVLAPLVDELLRLSASSFAPGLRVTVDVPPGLAVRGDAGQVRQVLLNLIGNARDAIGAHGDAPAVGAISITARAIQHDGSTEPGDALAAAAGAYVRISVADDGAGISRDSLRRIFEPFFTTKSSGHGLGLASVLGIVRAHGGGLRVVSPPGAGARFDVLWPADPAASTTAVAGDPAGSGSHAAASRTVLVVDDEDLVRDVVARMIVDLGYAAITAVDGRAALARLDTEHVDALLVDLTMPVMSGAELISTVRTRWPTLPIVLCSGYDRDRRGPVVADAYLPKPFRIDALEGVLAKLLREPETTAP